MLLEKIEKHAARADLNCAGKILTASIEEYGIDVDPRIVDATSTLGGGANIEELCGAVNGSMMVLGLLFNRDQPYESGEMKRIAKDFFEEFWKGDESVACRDLKKTKREDETCGTTVIPRVAAVLDRIVKREMARTGE